MLMWLQWPTISRQIFCLLQLPVCFRLYCYPEQQYIVCLDCSTAVCTARHGQTFTAVVFTRPDWQVEALCSHVVRSFLRLFVFLLPKRRTRHFEKQWTDIVSRSHLRSAARGDLAVPRARATTYHGERSFSVSGPSLWNSLPLSVRDPSLTMTQFCTHLKTFLFRRAYCT